MSSLFDEADRTAARELGPGAAARDAAGRLDDDTWAFLLDAGGALGDDELTDGERASFVAGFAVHDASAALALGQWFTGEGTGIGPDGARWTAAARGAEATGELPISGLRAAALGPSQAKASPAWLLPAVAAGVATRAAREARIYADEREQFGAKLSSIQELARRIGMMDEAASASVAALATSNVPAAVAAADAAFSVADGAVQLHGGNGYTRDFPVERLLRDAAALRALARVEG